MLKPKALKKGDTIGLVAPASPVKNMDYVERSAAVLRAQGFDVVIGPSCCDSYGYFAAPDLIRAADINNMFENPEIDGIFCLRGGYGTPRILDMLDYGMISENPKVFLGYSDITAIHVALNQISNLVTFHGPMPASDMVEDFDTFSLCSYLNAITSTVPIGFIENPWGIEPCALVKGKAEGIITGGNLSLITSTLGTPYEIDTRGKLLLIEEIDEYTYRIDRMLTQLRLSGKLDDCEGIVLGNFNNCVPQYPDFDLSLNQVFNDILVPTGMPILSNLMIGHCSPKITIPLGVNALLDADNLKLIINQAASTN